MTNLLRIQVVIILLAALGVCSGCAKAKAPVEHQVQVLDAQTGQKIAGANVTGQIDVRYTTTAQTDADGLATLDFPPLHLELHDWAKIIVKADGYPDTSVLAKVEDNTPTVVKVGQPQPTPVPTAAATAPVTSTVEAAAIPPLPTQLPAPGPLASVPLAERANHYKAKPVLDIDTGKAYYAAIITAKGNIILKLDAAKAPEHVKNFIFLSKEGYFDGLTFHRVEPGFVVQGGDPLGTGQGGPGYTIPGEFELKHIEGALAMARLPDQVNPNRESSGSQFYITLAPTPALDGQYSVFGQVAQGMDVVKAIQVGDKIERVIILE